MSSESLQEYEIMIAKRAGQLVERLEELSGTAIDLGRWIGYFTYVVLYTLCSDETKPFESGLTSWVIWRAYKYLYARPPCLNAVPTALAEGLRCFGTAM